MLTALRIHFDLSMSRAKHHPQRSQAVQVWLACVLAALSSQPLVPSLANASEIEWSAPARCGDAGAVAAQVEQLTERDLAASEDIDFVVEITESRPGSWLLRLHTRSRTGGDETIREVSGASCETLRDAAAVAIAMAIDAAHKVEAVHASAPAPPPPPRPSPPPVATQPSAATRVAFGVTAALVLEHGLLPRVAVGPALELTMGMSTLRLAVRATVFIPQRATVGEGSTASADFGLGTGDVFACWQPAFGAWRLLGCAGFELGLLTLHSDGFDKKTDLNRAVFGPLAELGATWHVIGTLRIALLAAAATLVPRDSFASEGKTLHREGPVSLRLGLGVELEF